jgi:hypothetical protein
MPPPAFPFHHESHATLNASAGVAFAYLDDFKKLSAHMEHSSGRMLGSRMYIETDSARGRAVGSKVRMSGRIIGMTLALQEVVIEREAPRRKLWQTEYANLLVIGDYRLGFELEPAGECSKLRVFIDYALPRAAPARWLGAVFGGMYARWCTERMVSDAVKHFP